MLKKKAVVFEWAMVIIGLIALTTAFFALAKKQDPFKAEPIGKKQYEIILAYQEGEKALFYIDQSAKYSALQAYFDLAENGGNHLAAKCGDYLGYALWNSKDKKIDDCFPDYKKNFELFFEDNLNEYLISYPSADIPTYNYIFQVAENGPVIEIIGAALESISIDILKEGAGESGKEKIKPEKKEEIGKKCPLIALVDVPPSFVCIDSSTNICKLRKEVVEKLEEAQEIAKKEGYQLQVTSAYRSYDQQQKIWDKYGRDSSRVARPSCTSPHTTGSSVDVVFKNQPHMSAIDPQFHIYEVNNIPSRKKLEEIMCSVGFIRYGNKENTKGEFWHYEYGGTERYKTGKEAGSCAVIV